LAFSTPAAQKHPGCSEAAGVLLIEALIAKFPKYFLSDPYTVVV
jgi:hypothetical protein